MKTSTNLDVVIEAAQPAIDRMVENFKKDTLERYNVPATARAIEYFKLDCLADVAYAIARYIKPTDDIKVLSVSARRGAIEINSIVTRDGVRHGFETDQVYAGGYNIQCLHIRYIVKTGLELLYKEPAAVKVIKDRIAGMKKIDRFNEEMKYAQDVRSRELKAVEKLALMSYDEVIDASYMQKYRHCTWETLNEGAHANYGTKEAYEAKKADDMAKVVERHMMLCSPERVKAIEKYYEKSRKRIQAKIDKL